MKKPADTFEQELSLTWNVLFFSTPSIANAVACLSTFSCACWGVAACGVISAIPLGCRFGAAAEPYRDLSVYISKGLGGICCFLPFGIALWSMFGLMFYGWWRLPMRRKTVDVFRIRAWLLCPVTVLIPGIVWGVIRCFKIWSHPHMGFTGPAGKPKWLDAFWIHLFGSMIWIPLLFGIALWLANRAAILAKEIAVEDRCAVCGYNLRGNVTGTCSECGNLIVDERSSEN
jgi:hypothetical protein